MFLKKFFGEVGNPHPFGNCAGDKLLDFEVRMAFQPIVDASRRSVYAYEALGQSVQTAAEYGVLRDMGINLFQGYLFAKPGLETLPVVSAEAWDSLE